MASDQQRTEHLYIVDPLPKRRPDGTYLIEHGLDADDVLISVTDANGRNIGFFSHPRDKNTVFVRPGRLTTEGWQEDLSAQRITVSKI